MCSRETVEFVSGTVDQEGWKLHFSLTVAEHVRASSGRRRHGSRLSFRRSSFLGHFCRSEFGYLPADPGTEPLLSLMFQASGRWGPAELRPGAGCSVLRPGRRSINNVRLFHPRLECSHPLLQLSLYLKKNPKTYSRAHW